jgi:hypothetical protein
MSNARALIRAVGMGAGLTGCGLGLALLSAVMELPSPVQHVGRLLFVPGDLLVGALKPGWHVPRASETALGIVATAVFYSLVCWILLRRPWSRERRR